MRTNLNQLSKNFREYYSTGKYKGFYKLRERQYKLSGKTHMTFTNGKKEIFAIGLFKEEALKKIFDQIDKLPDQKDSNLSESGQSLITLLPLLLITFLQF